MLIYSKVIKKLDEYVILNELSVFVSVTQMSKFKQSIAYDWFKPAVSGTAYDCLFFRLTGDLKGVRY
ncbi:MAG TPA: hypothetical protein VF008_17670 [Niastella sp.]